MIAIIDYDAGNLRSVQKALENIGADTIITSDPATVLEADAVVLPGVGAFKDRMDNLKAYGMESVVRETVASGKPFLGICLGFQMLFETSEEHAGPEGNIPGLGVFPGRVRLIHPGEGFKVPHMGWNSLRFAVKALCLKGFLQKRMSILSIPLVLPVPAHAIAAQAEYGQAPFPCGAFQGKCVGTSSSGEKRRGGVDPAPQFCKGGTRRMILIQPSTSRTGNACVWPRDDLMTGPCTGMILWTWRASGKPPERHASHVVDLDGARSPARPSTGPCISAIAKALKIPVQTGGGVRTLADIEELLGGGVQRVILGTSAVKNPELVRDAVKEYRDRIVVGIDAKDGYVAVDGWEKTRHPPSH